MVEQKDKVIIVHSNGYVEQLQDISIWKQVSACWIIPRRKGSTHNSCSTFVKLNNNIYEIVERKRARIIHLIEPENFSKNWEKENKKFLIGLNRLNLLVKFGFIVIGG